MKIGLLIVGFGRVGQALAKILSDEATLLKSRYNLDVEVKGIVDIKYGAIYSTGGLDLVGALRSINEYGSFEHHKDYIGSISPLNLIEKEGYDVMVEVTWSNIKTGEPALTYIKKAIESHKDVVTTNKGPFAVAYREIVMHTNKYNGIVRFEGTVMSGTPAISLGRECLAGAQIYMMEGILNGTTNYILSRMEEGISFGEALHEAQRLGYAEADPTSDIEGWDAAAKAVILANSIYGLDLKISDVDLTGISSIGEEDVKKALDRGSRIKLLALISPDGDVSVRPTYIDDRHPLYNVSGVLNALLYRTKMLGDVMISGPGAGPVEAAQAIISDLIYLSRIYRYRAR
jgi:homoserine dehydrogenase